MRTACLAILLFLGPILGVLAIRGLERTASGGTALQLSPTQLLDSSDLVVEGRVLSTQGVEGAHGVIYTDVDLVVDRTFWGEPQEIRRIRLPGGVLPDGRGMWVPGVPLPQPNQAGLWFLSGQGRDDVRIPIGLGQGALQVVTAPAGQRYLARENRALALIGPGSSETKPAGSRTLSAYTETIGEIRAAAEARLRREAALDGTGASRGVDVAGSSEGAR